MKREDIDKYKTIIDNKKKEDPKEEIGEFSSSLMDNFNYDDLEDSVLVSDNPKKIMDKEVLYVKDKDLDYIYDDILYEEDLLDKKDSLFYSISNYVSKKKEEIYEIEKDLESFSGKILIKKDDIDFAKLGSLKKRLDGLKMDYYLAITMNDLSYLECDEILEKYQTFNDSEVLNECFDRLDDLKLLFSFSDKFNYAYDDINYRYENILKRDEDFITFKQELSLVTEMENIISNNIQNEIGNVKKIESEIDEFMSKEDDMSLSYLRRLSNSYFDYILDYSILVRLLHYITFNLFNSEEDRINKLLKEKTKLLNSIYNDQLIKINSELNILKAITNSIKKSINSIKNLKEVFKNKFFKYKYYIPEYDRIYESLVKLESSLLSKNEIIGSSIKSLDKVKVKIKNNIV